MRGVDGEGLRGLGEAGRGEAEGEESAAHEDEGSKRWLKGEERGTPRRARGGLCVVLWKPVSQI
jgi:hypothetical protein